LLLGRARRLDPLRPTPHPGPASGPPRTSALWPHGHGQGTTAAGLGVRATPRPMVLRLFKVPPPSLACPSSHVPRLAPSPARRPSRAPSPDSPLGSAAGANRAHQELRVDEPRLGSCFLSLEVHRFAVATLEPKLAAAAFELCRRSNFRSPVSTGMKHSRSKPLPPSASPGWAPRPAPLTVAGHPLERRHLVHIRAAGRHPCSPPSSSRRSVPGRCCHRQELHYTEPHPGNPVSSPEVHWVGAIAGRPSQPPWPIAAVLLYSSRIPASPPSMSTPTSFPRLPLPVPSLTRAPRCPSHWWFGHPDPPSAPVPLSSRGRRWRLAGLQVAPWSFL
jgi:hypothetical protein